MTWQVQEPPETPCRSTRIPAQWTCHIQTHETNCFIRRPKKLCFTIAPSNSKHDLKGLWGKTYPLTKNTKIRQNATTALSTVAVLPKTNLRLRSSSPSREKGPSSFTLYHNRRKLVRQPKLASRRPLRRFVVWNRVRSRWEGEPHDDLNVKLGFSLKSKLVKISF